MKTFKDTSEVATAFEKVISPAIPYEFSWDEFENVEELRKANEYPKDSEILAFVNTKRKNAARAAELQVTLKANNIEKPTLQNDTQVQLKTVYNALVAAGRTHEEARSIASTSVGAEWAK